MTPSTPDSAALRHAPAWRGDDLSEPTHWTVPLDATAAELLVEATRRLRPSPGWPETTLPEDSPVAPGAAWATRVTRLLRTIGFAVVDDFPVAAVGDDADLTLWLLAGLFGEPIRQNIEGQRVDRVRNEQRATVRGAKTNRALGFHTDFANATPDVFGLLTVRAAAQGGDSLLASGHLAYQALSAEDPECVATLEGEFLFDRSGDVPENEPPLVPSPVFRRSGDDLRVLYNRARIHRGHRAAGRPLTRPETRAFDVLDAHLAAPGVALRHRLRRGQVLFVNNRWMLHSRTAFTDGPDAGHRRELLRVWLRAPLPTSPPTSVPVS
jgi:alpha-ketoglutarate-dependent taurine dioxygenase